MDGFVQITKVVCRVFTHVAQLSVDLHCIYLSGVRLASLLRRAVVAGALLNDAKLRWPLDRIIPILVHPSHRVNTQ